MGDDDINVWFEAQLEKQLALDEQDQHLDRWSERNKGKGWDYDDVQAEFMDYFDERDIADFTADDWNELELEFERVITMLNRAETSGKKPREYYND